MNKKVITRGRNYDKNMTIEMTQETYKFMTVIF